MGEKAEMERDTWRAKRRERRDGGDTESEVDIEAEKDTETKGRPIPGAEG